VNFQTELVRVCVVLSCLSGASCAHAQMTPVGYWHNIDDNTGAVKGLVRIEEKNGVLTGYVEKILRKDTDPNALCTECSGERKDKPVLGMEVIHGAKKVDGKDIWEGGRILDPENGKEYTLRLTPVEGGKKLEVRGYFAFFWRTQTWNRVP